VADRSPWLTELGVRLGHRAVSLLADDTDFGGASLGPQVRVRTRTGGELQAVLELARRESLPVAIRGAGHSSGGHTSGASGIVLEHAPAGEPIELGDEFVDVPAHWTWNRVESELRAVGRDLVVATSSLDTTVAGTLSVGGFGIRSVRSGPQVDHVRALRLVCATGDCVWCSPATNSDLFHSALTGLGQVGIIDRVRIATRERHDYLASITCRHESFSELASCLLSIEHQSRPLDYCAALAKQGRIESFLASCHRSEGEARRHLDELPTLGRVSPERAVIPTERFEISERAMPLEHWRSCRNLWCDYCFDAEAFPRFAAFVDATLGASIREHLAYVMSIAPRRGVPFALDMRPPSDRQLYSVGLFYSVPGDDHAGVRRAREYHVLALEACLALGGRPYLHGLWGGASGLSSAQLKSVYGSTYERLGRVRRRVDPSAILNPWALNHG
jgi:FAD/FMN-containing dehydrogenase